MSPFIGSLAGSPPGDLDACGPDDLAAQRVAGAQDVHHHGLATGNDALPPRLEQGLVPCGVERLAFGLDPLQTLPAKDVLEFRVDELDAVQEPVELRLLLRRYQREVELVQHLEEIAHER